MINVVQVLLLAACVLKSKGLETATAHEGPTETAVQQCSPVVSCEGEPPQILPFEEWKQLQYSRQKDFVCEDISTHKTHATAPSDDAETAHNDVPPSRDDDLSSEAVERDAGRFNYASLDCAATVIKHNSEAKGANNALSENRDRYMLNQCSAEDQFLILELCEDILVDTIHVANFEFFSSIFKELRVSVSDRYPVRNNAWKHLGTFTGQNARRLPRFNIDNPMMWARYVRIEFLSFYGNEYYCPISVLRVFGTSMMEDIKHGVPDNEPPTELEAVPDATVRRCITKVPQSSCSRQSTEPYPTNIDESQGPRRMLTDAGLITSGTICQPGPLQEPATELLSECTTSSSEITEKESSLKSSDTAFAIPICPLPSKESSLHSGRVESFPINSTSLPGDTIAEHSTQTDISTLAVTANSQSQAKATLNTTVPSTKESIYKSIMKRIAALEANVSRSSDFLGHQSLELMALFKEIERNSSLITQQHLTSAYHSIENIKFQYQVMQTDLKNHMHETRLQIVKSLEQHPSYMSNMRSDVSSPLPNIS